MKIWSYHNLKNYDFKDVEALSSLIGKIRFKVTTQRFCNCLLATNYVTRKVAYLGKEIASFFSKRTALLLPKYESTFYDQ